MKELIEELNQKIKKKIENKTVNELSSTDSFLVKKYMYHILQTLSEIGNRDIGESFFWKDNDFNLESKKKLMKDEILIQEGILFQEFKKHLKKENIFTPSVFLYRVALEKLIQKKMHYYEDYSPPIHISKAKIGENELIRVIF